MGSRTEMGARTQRDGVIVGEYPEGSKSKKFPAWKEYGRMGEHENQAHHPQGSRQEKLNGVRFIDRSSEDSQMIQTQCNQEAGKCLWSWKSRGGSGPSLAARLEGVWE